MNLAFLPTAQDTTDNLPSPPTPIDLAARDEKPEIIPDIGPEILSNCTFYNSTSFSGEENDSPFSSPQFSEILLTEQSKHTSTARKSAYIDPMSLSELEIRELVDKKMRRLDLFNSKILPKEQSQLMKKYKVTTAQLELLKRLQRRIRNWIMKRKFLKAMRMNDYVESRKNFLMLKRCMEKFDKKSSKEYNSYYESLLDLLLI